MNNRSDNTISAVCLALYLAGVWASGWEPERGATAVVLFVGALVAVFWFRNYKL